MTSTAQTEMLLVAYYAAPDLVEHCSWCDRPAVYRISAMNGTLTDYGCDDCTARHMRGNAGALDGGPIDFAPSDGDEDASPH